MKWVKRVLYGLVALAVAGAIVRAYMPRPARVETARVRRGPMVVWLEAEGRTRVVSRYVVSAPLGGEVARVDVRAGDAVRDGAVLARILPLAPSLLDPRARAEAEARVRQADDDWRRAQAAEERARVALEQARREMARQREFVTRGVSPPVVLESAETDVRAREADARAARFGVQVAGHAVETARAALRQPHADAARAARPLEVRAPAGGRVLRVMRESAGVVAAGTALFELGDPTALEVVVDVLTADAVQVREGARVELTAWGGERELAGRVRRVEPSAFTRVSALGVEEQRVNVVVDLASPREAWSAMGDGYRLEARIEVWSDPNALMVPASALFRHGESWAAYVIEGGHARRRVVQIGRRSATEAQVLRGLREGEAVVAWPGDNLTDGAAVQAADARRGGG